VVVVVAAIVGAVCTGAGVDGTCPVTMVVLVLVVVVTVPLTHLPLDRINPS
jgi:hypothetical protein